MSGARARARKTGHRHERRARDLLIAQGFEVEKTRAGGSRFAKINDFYGAFDLIASKPGRQRWIQVTVMSAAARHRPEMEDAAAIFFGWRGAITIELWRWPDKPRKDGKSLQFHPEIFAQGAWRSGPDYFVDGRKDPLPTFSAATVDDNLHLAPDLPSLPSLASSPPSEPTSTARGQVDHPRRLKGKRLGRVAGDNRPAAATPPSGPRRVFVFFCGSGPGRCPFHATGFPTQEAANRAYEAHRRRSHGGGDP